MSKNKKIGISISLVVIFLVVTCIMSYNFFKPTDTYIDVSPVSSNKYTDTDANIDEGTQIDVSVDEENIISTSKQELLLETEISGSTSNYVEELVGASEDLSSLPTDINAEQSSKYVKWSSENSVVVNDPNVALTANTYSIATDSGTTQVTADITIFDSYMILNNVAGLNALINYTSTGTWASGYESISTAMENNSTLACLPAIIINFSSTLYGQVNGSINYDNVTYNGTSITSLGVSNYIFGYDNTLYLDHPLVNGNGFNLNIYGLTVACDASIVKNVYSLGIDKCTITLNNLTEVYGTSIGDGYVFGISDGGAISLSSTSITYNFDKDVYQFGIAKNVGTMNLTSILIKSTNKKISCYTDSSIICNKAIDLSLTNVFIDGIESITVENGNGGILCVETPDSATIENIFIPNIAMKVNGIDRNRYYGDIDNAEPIITKVPITTTDETQNSFEQDVNIDTVDPNCATAYISGDVVTTVYNLALMESWEVDTNPNSIAESWEANSSTNSSGSAEDTTEYEITITYPTNWNLFNKIVEVQDTAAFNTFARANSDFEIYTSGQQYALGHLNNYNYATIRNATFSSNSLLVHIEDIGKQSTLYIARYDSNNKLLDIQSSTVEKEGIYFIELPEITASYIKLFLWDEMVPLTEAYKYSISSAN